MGGGLMQLIAYGAQDILLCGTNINKLPNNYQPVHIPVFDYTHIVN
jgi:hypothetical protein